MINVGSMTIVDLIIVAATIKAKSTKLSSSVRCLVIICFPNHGPHLRTTY